jgi:hypothetical protein
MRLRRLCSSCAWMCAIHLFPFIPHCVQQQPSYYT